MGEIIHGANGGFSGKAGSVIGSSWRDINYIKGLPKRRKKGPSDKQLQQQLKFAMAITFLKPIKDLLNVGYSDYRQGRATGYNIALRHLLSNAVAGSYPDYEIDYSAVQVSAGSLLKPLLPKIEPVATEQLRISWEYYHGQSGTLEADKANLLVYNVNKQVHLALGEIAGREETSVEITVPAAFSGDEVVAWLFFTNAEHMKHSDSVYAGRVTLL